MFKFCVHAECPVTLSKEDEFIRFFLAIWKNHIDLRPPGIRFLQGHTRQAPYLAFLQVIMEDTDAAVISKLLNDNSTKYLAQWQKAKQCNEATLRLLWRKIRRMRKGTLSHRAYMSPDDFAKGLRQYLQTVERLRSPFSMIESRDWRKTCANFGGIHWFGDLAKFDYLRQICLLSLCQCPDEIPHTGKGPIKGLRMIYGENASLRNEGKHLLELLLKRTNDPRVVFALEDMLCLMHYSPIDDGFRTYFRDHDLRTVLAKYLDEYGNGRRCYSRPRLPCFTRRKRTH